MSRIGRTATRLVAVLAVVVLATTAAAFVPARAAQPPRTHNDTRPLGSAPVEVDFAIEHFGIVADLPPDAEAPEPQGQAPFGEVRFRVDEQWTDWQALGQDGAQAEGQFTGSLVSVDGADAYQVRAVPAWGRNWRAAAINTKAQAAVGPLPTATAATGARCMSRADWGADESISGWANGDTRSFQPVQVMTVHHTATSNNPDQDYAATVRAIYSYHVQTNGWSDIGYQYLIDGAGVLYEGRSAGHTSRSCITGGGDGSDFGHEKGTDEIVTGAHVGNWNSGNVGLSLIGCFENGGGCTGDTAPPSPAVGALVTQLADLSARHSLDPTSTTTYVSPIYPDTTKVIATVSGHSDWGGTACPGDYLYDQLPTIRTNAKNGMPATPSVAVTSAPGLPTSVSATASGSTVDLTWAVPVSDGGSPITGYQVSRGTTASEAASGTPPVWSGTATTTTDGPDDGSWYYGVRACNGVGCGSAAVAGPVTTASATITSASCRGASCSFSGTGYGTLTWDFGNGSTASGSSVRVKYTQTGSYVVTFSDSQPTTDTRTVICISARKGVTCTVA